MTRINNKTETPIRETDGAKNLVKEVKSAKVFVSSFSPSELDTSNQFNLLLPFNPKNLSPAGQKWYENYIQKTGKELNFKEALVLLNSDANLSDVIKNDLRKAFGIPDGDVTNDKQGAKGTCHLLAVRDALSINEFGQNVIKDIVKQNDDGTVTVTFKGVEDSAGNSRQFIIPNQEISESYRSKVNPKGGASDPDDAALEIAYTKLIEEKSIEYSNLSKTEKDLSTQIEKQKLEEFKEQLTKHGDDRSKMVLDYMKANSSLSYQELLNKSNNQSISLILTYGFDILDKSKKVELLEKELSKVNLDKSILREKFGKLDNFDGTRLDLSLGGDPKKTFKLLTGLDAVQVNKTADFEKGFDKFKDKKIPMTVAFKKDNPALNILSEHEYTVRSTHTDKITGEKKVTLKNPNGYNVVLNYDDLLHNMSLMTYLSK